MDKFRESNWQDVRNKDKLGYKIKIIILYQSSKVICPISINLQALIN